MKITKLVLAGVAVALFGGSAVAADMAVKARPVIASVYDWTGFYVGGNIGYGWGDNTRPVITGFDDPRNASGVAAFLSPAGLAGVNGNLYPNLNPSGVFGGAQIGYDKQFGRFVLGAVADIQASAFSASGTAFTPAPINVTEPISAKIDWFGTVRGKAGIAANDWLFYGTGGLAYGDTKSSVNFFCTPGGAGCGAATINFGGSRSEVKAGWAAGAGVAKAFGNWNVGVEYLHIDLGRSTVVATTLIPASFPLTTITASQRFVEDTVRLTVNYKWGGPVVAKY